MRRAVIAALAIFLALVPAAHARTDDLKKPVLLVVGPEDGTGSCSRFDDFTSALSDFQLSIKGTPTFFSGTIDAIGPFKDSPGCSHTLDLTLGDSWDDYADAFAKLVGDRTVDVVGFGGGGLIVRRALQRHPELRIEDAVTLGTPHAGSHAMALQCGAHAMCADLEAGSSLMRILAAATGINPQGRGGTDWTAIASESDVMVEPDSAVGMRAEHRIIYEAPGPSHEGLLTDLSTATDAHVRHSHSLVSWTQWNKSPHTFVRVAKDLAFGAGDADLTCALQQSAPDQCGVMPVIFVPGFGASELQCTTALGTANMWPGALTNQKYFVDMALSNDGVGSYAGNDCGKSMKATGNVVQEAGGKDIHKASWAWIQKIAKGHAYQYGWDFRKGPDQALAGLDKLIDQVRAKHGVTRVVIVCHSYGGLLTRWYIDDPARARKVARVANFGSPWWGVPKPWFAMAYGYETPVNEVKSMDTVVPNDVFKLFAKNLTGLYYLFPSQAWYDHAPKVLRNWLEVDGTPATSIDQQADDIRAFGGNGALAQTVAKGHKEHIDGFTTANGVDWRIFVGSGEPTLGHVRATSGSTDVQYSWINGDGTVPLISQRQSDTADGNQLGDDVPTYNFCHIPHMVELEDAGNQAAVTPFITEGKDPIVDGEHLRKDPCPLKAEQFKVTGDEDELSVGISKLAEGVASKASVGDTPGTLTLTQAEDAHLVDVIHQPDGLVFVTDGTTPLHVHVAGAGMLEVTPLTGDMKTGAARVYDLGAAGVTVDVDGARSRASAPGRAADRTPPRTTARRAHGKLTLRARDASGVAETMVRIGGRRAKPYTKPVRVPRRAKVRYWSIDVFGNTESVRVIAGAR